MTFSKICLLILILLLFLFSLGKAAKAKPCSSSSSCGGNNLEIRFPFWLIENHTSSCGYPSFNLYCTNRHETAINLPNSGPFIVQEIKRQSIRLKDPENCLARRLLTFDASETPFSPIHLHNYTFLICPNEEDLKSFHYKPIHCLSNSTTSFFAIPSEHTGSSMMIPSSCQIFKKSLIPVSSPLVYVELNDQDLWLKWDTPDCTSCNDFASLCGFIDNTTLQVTCFKSGNLWLRTLKIFSVILFSLVLMFGTSAFVISFCRKELAKKVVESSRKTKNVRWRNDTSCPICFLEYVNEDSVMSLLECEHWFHTDCISRWIKLHMSCPVCRIKPSSCSKIVVKNVV